ncbi:hypothetical protein DRN67_01385 [Candidatus Micrarchaeota archaeon]|nr:MAG: hypothetical protein DRN67_01385 [Candidatus Micrarchaeota archaeon]
MPKRDDHLGDLSEAKKALGGKGAHLVDMYQDGLPVPDFAIITTEACLRYMKTGKIDAALEDTIRAAIREIEQRTGKTFFDFEKGGDLLLLSGRSGAEVSMPGMMETAVKRGIEANPSLEIGICGEQGVERDSVINVMEVLRRKYRFDSISGSSFRLPGELRVA